MDKKIYVVMEICEVEYESSFTNIIGVYSKYESAVNAIKKEASDLLGKGFDLRTKKEKDIDSINFHENGLFLENIDTIYHDHVPYDFITYCIEETDLIE